jgi:Kef-type K+ transport system membrane component KefB
MDTLSLIGITILASYYMGHLTKKLRLPSLIGYMIIGILLGSSVLGYFDEELVEKLGFINEIALGFVAIGIGLELSLSSLKRQGIGIVAIIFAESFAAFFLVLTAVYLFTRDLPLSLIFGAMAPASAPAGTVAVIQELRAKGSLTKALYAVVGFDDGLAIVIFGFAAAMAKSLLISESAGEGCSLLPGILEAAREIGLSVLVGSIIGFIFSNLVRFVRDNRDMIVLTFAAVLIAIGCANRWHLSLILINMITGFILVNTRKAELAHKVSNQLLIVMPLLFILFFSLAGAHLNLAAIPSLGMLGAIYIIARSTGLVGGSRIGGMFGKTEDKIKKYVGMGILSQAGVAIGLALIVKHDFSAIGSEHASYIGTAVITTITATCVFFELVGPVLTKIALTKAGEVPVQKEQEPPAS